MSTARRSECVAIAYGSNRGDRQGHVRFALGALAELPASRVVSCSRTVETAPVGGPPQGPYLNGAVLLETDLSPFTLLAALHDLETQRSRTRSVRNEARTLDLDVVFYGDRTLRTPRLVLPHPRAHLREFVLEPLLEIAPSWVHPILGLSVTRLCAALRWTHSQGVGSC